MPGPNVRIRLSRAVRVGTAAPFLLIYVPELILAAATHKPPFPTKWLVVYPAAGVGMFIILMVSTSWMGITLTPTDALVHRLRRRRIAWSEIVDITEDHQFGAGKMVIWTTGAKRVVPRAPIMPFPGIGRQRFEQDFDTVRQWWLARREQAPDG